MNTNKIVNAVIADGEQCDAETVKRLLESLTDEDRAAMAADPAMGEQWMIDTLINTQPPN